MSVADQEGVQGVHSNPPLRPNYFIFMGNFRKNYEKSRKRTPFVNLNPSPEILDPPLDVNF